MSRPGAFPGLFFCVYGNSRCHGDHEGVAVAFPCCIALAIAATKRPLGARHLLDSDHGQPYFRTRCRTRFSHGRLLTYAEAYC